MSNRAIFDKELAGMVAGEFSEKILFEIRDPAQSGVLSIIADVVFDKTYIEHDENGMPIASSTPMFTWDESTYNKAISIAPEQISEVENSVYARRIKYRVENVQPDGMGMLIFYLKKAAEISEAELQTLINKGL